MRFFFFGSLRDGQILEVVIGRPLPQRALPAASLPGYRLERMARETFPLLVEAVDEVAPGVVVEGLLEADIARIHFFESIEYEPQTHTVDLAAGGRRACQIFAATAAGGRTGEAWRYEDWRPRHQARELREARLWMAFYGLLSPAEADRLWDQAVAEGRPLEDLVTEITGQIRPRRHGS